MDRFYKKQEKIRALMYGFAAKGHGVVVWGMNGVCQDLLAGFQMQSSIVVCDSDPRKLNQIRGIIGKHPSEILGLLKEAKLLVINSLVISRKSPNLFIPTLVGGSNLMKLRATRLCLLDVLALKMR